MFMCRELPVRTEHNKIPDSVLRDILGVYEFGEEKDLKTIPNDFICMRNGDFWTTWTRVFEIRDYLKRQKNPQTEQQFPRFGRKTNDKNISNADNVRFLRLR